jgi:hypothetical protein
VECIAVAAGSGPNAFKAEVELLEMIEFLGSPAG